MAEDKFKKLRKVLPEKYPENRYKRLTQAVSLAPMKSNCDQDTEKSYQNSLFFDYRARLYPIYPDSLKTLDQVSYSLHSERHLFTQLANLKSTLLIERTKFETFHQDCVLIQGLVDQIKLLESHLKIDRFKRQPTQAVSTKEISKNAELRMSKNISRQLNFAKRHLESNERLFLIKWKNYFDFESDKSLCPR
jgi:hypothetical protein